MVTVSVLDTLLVIPFKLASKETTLLLTLFTSCLLALPLRSLSKVCVLLSVALTLCVIPSKLAFIVATLLLTSVTSCLDAFPFRLVSIEWVLELIALISVVTLSLSWVTLEDTSLIFVSTTFILSAIRELVSSGAGVQSVDLVPSSTLKNVKYPLTGVSPFPYKEKLISPSLFVTLEDVFDNLIHLFFSIMSMFKYSIPKL